MLDVLMVRSDTIVSEAFEPLHCKVIQMNNGRKKQDTAIITRRAA